MNGKFASFIIAGCIFITVLTGCAAPAATTSARVEIPVDQNLNCIVNTPYGAADDLMIAPGLGPQYRGTMDGVDPVPMGYVKKDGASISWRSSAAIAPGGTRYDSIKVFPGANITESRLYTEHVPEWLTLACDGYTIGLGNGFGSVLAMKVGADAPLGNWTFDLGIEVNGTDYGLFPVAILVTDTPEVEPSAPYGTLVPSGAPPAASSNGTEYPDDIVITPGGQAYRANVHTGQANPWPPVQTSFVHLATGNIAATVQYRADIITNAGQVRNNIVTVSGNGLTSSNLRLELFAIGVPEGFTLTQSGGDGLPGELFTLLRIAVAAEVPPGDYSFSLALAPGGVYLGTIPVTVHVEQPPNAT